MASSPPCAGATRGWWSVRVSAGGSDESERGFTDAAVIEALCAAVTTESRDSASEIGTATTADATPQEVTEGESPVLEAAKAIACLHIFRCTFLLNVNLITTRGT